MVGVGAAVAISQVSKSEILLRPATLRNMKGTAPDAIASLLTQARVPGGIISIYANCTKPSQLLFSSKSETLKNGLDYVSSTDASDAWIFKDGVVVVGFKQAQHTLLKTVISEVKINPNETLSLATQELLGSPELKEAIAKSGLEEATISLGFSAVQTKSNGVSIPAENRKQEPLRGRTLEEALNALALSRSSAVWHYEQYTCGKNSSFRVSWMVTGNQ
jgi:hypothetical protein